MSPSTPTTLARDALMGLIQDARVARARVVVLDLGGGAGPRLLARLEGLRRELGQLVPLEGEIDPAVPDGPTDPTR